MAGAIGVIGAIGAIGAIGVLVFLANSQKLKANSQKQTATTDAQSERPYRIQSRLTAKSQEPRAKNKQPNETDRTNQH